MAAAVKKKIVVCGGNGFLGPWCSLPVFFFFPLRLALVNEESNSLGRSSLESRSNGLRYRM